MKKTTPNYINDIQGCSLSTINVTSPFMNVPCAFNWLNTYYPITHVHEHWEIHVAISGTALHKINGQELIINRGQTYFIRPQDRHSIHPPKNSAEPYIHINFVIETEFMRRLISLYGDYDEILNAPGCVKLSLDEADVNFIRDRTLLIQNLPHDEYVAHTKLIVSVLLIKYFEKKMLFNSQYPDWLNSFIIYISSPASFGKDVQELAKNTSYSYSRLARIFKEYTGETIVNFINAKKMNHAKRLLASTNLSTLQISNQIGYASLSSFNHLFKSTYGITPSEFRKEQSRKDD